MKKQILTFSALALLATAAIFTGCKKDDVEAPIITLNGAAAINLSLQSSYTELGATAEDNEDGPVDVTITGTVNKDLKGAYTITYSATDAAGNTGTETRTVTVVNDADKYAGTYTCTDPAFGSSSPWTQTITASTTLNNTIVFSQFAARTGNNAVTATLTGGTHFVLNNKTQSGLGANSCTFSYTPNGNGTAVALAGGKYSFSIKYFEERIAGGSGCTAVAPTPFEDTFTQQ